MACNSSFYRGLGARRGATARRERTERMAAWRQTGTEGVPMRFSATKMGKHEDLTIRKWGFEWGIPIDDFLA